MSSKFTQVFNTLPPEAQQLLMEKHLVNLLDAIPKDRSKKVIAAATRLQTKFRKAPKLDLRAKRKLLSNLLDDLTRDAKVSFIKERSNRDELLSEIVHSLVSWLNDIWSVVYEYSVNFLMAHTCLLFVAETLAQLSESSTLGGCKCSVMNLPVEFVLRDQSGKVMKRFSVLGPQNIDRVLLWIWRDLFVCLFAKGSQRDKGKVPDFLEDIQSILGVSALQRLLYGGKPSGDEDEDEEEDEEDEEYLFGDHACGGDDSEYDSDEADRCPCNFHASYWSENLNGQRIPLRECVETRLFTIFQESPSLRIHHTLLAISHNLPVTEARIARFLSEIAGDTPDNLVAALDIHISNGDQSKIVSLLESHKYLLRPRDAVTLQCAIATLDGSPYHSRSLGMLENELEDSLRAVYATIRTCFSHIEEDANKKELAALLKLKVGSPARKDRVEQWVERAITTSNGPMHPMAFAAIMMGLPMLPGVDEDDADILNYVDLDQDDPDLDDLREEYRPNLKGRFDGWVHLGETMKGGLVLLAKLYVKAIEMMPYLRGTDIVNEMVSRLRERPNKNHVLEALGNLSSFAKMQRKKLNLARGEQRRTTNKAAAAAAGAPSQGRASSATNTPTSPAPSPAPAPPPFMTFTFGSPPIHGPPPPPLPFPFPSVPGGMEDVD